MGLSMETPSEPIGYEYLLEAEEKDVLDDTIKPKHRDSTAKYLANLTTTFFASLIIAFTIWFLICLTKIFQTHLIPPPTGIPSPKNVDCNCGETIEIALSRGCKYDAMATSWLPSACRDDELSAEFDRAGPDGEWKYYKTQAGNETYTLEEVSMLAEKKGDEASFWTTHEWHMNHCLFYWRKESRARVSGKAIEKSFEGTYHIKHCEDVWKSCRPLQEINTKSSAGLNSDSMDDG